MKLKKPLVVFISPFSAGQSMDERGFLRVNSFLQVEGQQNIFAFGDCSNADVKKQVVSVMAQLPVVTKNVKSQLSNVDELQAYTPGAFHPQCSY